MVTAYQLDPKGKMAKNTNPGSMQSKVYFMGLGGLITTAEEIPRSSPSCSSTAAS